jgi:hypothetical protein
LSSASSSLSPSSPVATCARLQAIHMTPPLARTKSTEFSDFIDTYLGGLARESDCPQSHAENPLFHLRRERAETATCSAP